MLLMGFFCEFLEKGPKTLHNPTLATRNVDKKALFDGAPGTRLTIWV
jgi:hypothetical protein